ncbi:MAG: radical SAM protein [Candidatus Omnitrophica bacterium]|nr:radical SAM protein [Candidatus Omnitrophota bacterium]MDD5670790.1 radical SAM protein [Candidatus Omnitrophota bacterium]
MPSPDLNLADDRRKSSGHPPFKVLLIVPDIRADLYVHCGSIYEGVAYLSAFLKQAGYAVELFVPKTAQEAEALEDCVRRCGPDLIGMSCATNSYKYVREWSTRIKVLRPGVPIICGGVHPTIAPDEVMAHPAIDMICRGEGEYVLLEVLKRLQKKESLRGIGGIWFKENGTIVRNPPGTLRDFDEFPFPDLDIFQIENSFYHRNRFGTLRISRGCPYACTYCCNPSVRAVYPDGSNYVRFRSPENAIAFIEEYLKRYPYLETLAFLDDVLFLNTAWFERFVDLYRQKIRLPFACRGRVNLFNERMAQLLKDANCYEVTFGVEAGNDWIRNEVLGRQMTKEAIVKAFKLAKAYGLKTRANNMIGVPFETLDSIWETVRLNAELDYDVSLNCVFFPFQGSKLYTVCRDKGFLDEREVADAPFSEESLLNLPGIRKKQILYFKLWFDILVGAYKRAPKAFGFLEWLHRQKFYPYGLLIQVYRGCQQLRKLGYRIKMKLGLAIKRYTARGVPMPKTEPVSTACGPDSGRGKIDGN